MNPAGPLEVGAIDGGPMGESSAETTARHLEVHGRVQGVFFRDSTRRQARQAGASGWVRNREDGAVEMWLEGPPEAVDSVERWVNEGGPQRARVEQVEVADAPPEGHEGFVVRR